ncbi:hypothetical protein EVAR_21484_1 [Eumeta japonica]|uniref:Uncharacterized protein n=1 Tax=Eumeta variegata TaxID=151549 RepID=A0A4C1UZH9_EUMVA|nr:hypothetical protein EVAR_21484_1 [Eumeta japonica]
MVCVRVRARYSGRLVGTQTATNHRIKSYYGLNVMQALQRLVTRVRRGDTRRWYRACTKLQETGRRWRRRGETAARVSSPPPARAPRYLVVARHAGPASRRQFSLMSFRIDDGRELISARAIALRKRTIAIVNKQIDAIGVRGARCATGGKVALNATSGARAAAGRRAVCTAGRPRAALRDCSLAAAPRVVVDDGSYAKPVRTKSAKLPFAVIQTDEPLVRQARSITMRT